MRSIGCVVGHTSADGGFFLLPNPVAITRIKCLWLRFSNTTLTTKFCSHFRVVFGKFRRQKEDISWTERTYVGFAGDKGLIFRTYNGQMLDKDKVKTNARPILDKC